MRTDLRVWIPVIGIGYGIKDEFIIYNKEWFWYQAACSVLFILSILWFNIVL